MLFSDQEIIEQIKRKKNSLKQFKMYHAQVKFSFERQIFIEGGEIEGPPFVGHPLSLSQSMHSWIEVEQWGHELAPVSGC